MGIDPGENGILPSQPLTDVTNTPEWQQIGTDFPIGFSMYTKAMLDSFTGTVISLNNGDLRVSIESLNGTASSLQILTMDLPGLEPIKVAIPGPEDSSMLQSMGIALQSKLLTVVVNCTIVTSAWLSSMPQSLTLSSVEALNPPTTVSSGNREGGGGEG